jgi:hypothetical protein
MPAYLQHVPVGAIIGCIFPTDPTAKIRPAVVWRVRGPSLDVVQIQNDAVISDTDIAIRDQPTIEALGLRKPSKIKLARQTTMRSDRVVRVFGYARGELLTRIVAGASRQAHLSVRWAA